MSGESLDSQHLTDVLHRLRSNLAGIQAEAEILELDGADADRLLTACALALEQLRKAEALSDQATAQRNEAPRLVLLEDDERLGATLARRMLREGIETCLVQTVRSAIAWTSGGRALLAADLTALEAATEEETRAVRRVGPVVITGATLAAAKSRAKRFTPYEVLIKPVEPARLAALIRAHPSSEST